jgi:hypothetical protein
LYIQNGSQKLHSLRQTHWSVDHPGDVYLLMVVTQYLCLLLQQGISDFIAKLTAISASGPECVNFHLYATHNPLLRDPINRTSR